MKKLFLAASGLFSSIPGVTVILKGVGTPPEYEYIFGGVIEAFGALSLIILWVNRKGLKKVAKTKITTHAITLGILSFAFLVAYIALFNWCVVKHPTHGTVYYPLWLSGYAADVVAKAGGRWQALDRYGNHAVYAAIHKMPIFASVITTILLLLVYQGIFTTLTMAFGLLGFHAKQDL
jgi:hypothetical protein